MPDYKIRKAEQLIEVQLKSFRKAYEAFRLSEDEDLQAEIDANAQRISESMLGSVQRVLVVGPAKRGEGVLAARVDNNRIVNFQGDASLINRMVKVRITDVFPHTLGGELVKE